MASNKLALSFAIGMYIAFSPFPGFHSILILFFSWALVLNLPLVFIVASINNPWTMIPFYSLDYAFGYYVLHDFFGQHNGWVISLDKIFGMGKVCIMSFLLGGNILGIVFALATHPVMLKIFKKLLVKYNGQVSSEVIKVGEEL